MDYLMSKMLPYARSNTTYLVIRKSFPFRTMPLLFVVKDHFGHILGSMNKCMVFIKVKETYQEVPNIICDKENYEKY